MSAESARITPVPIEDAPTNNEVYEGLAKILREKILFGLAVYPFLSPSMLHVFLGTATPKSLWKDVVLEALLKEGLVCKDEVTLTSPHDRTQTYTILRLADAVYITPRVQTSEESSSTQA